MFLPGSIVRWSTSDALALSIGEVIVIDLSLLNQFGRSSVPPAKTILGNANVVFSTPVNMSVAPFFSVSEPEPQNVVLLMRGREMPSSDEFTP